MKRALITGITGQDGSYLAELLLSKGYEVHGLVRRVALEDRLHRMQRINHILDDITLHAGSIDNYASVFQVVAEVKPTECYHLAAQSFVSYAFEDEFSTLDMNVKGTQYILSAIKKLVPDCRFYFAASSEMFGHTTVCPQNETTSFHPRSPYGISKVAGYYLAQNYREAYALHVSSGILFNHESPRRGFEFVTRKITASAARIKLGLEDTVELGNLDAKRDWGHAREYVEGMWRMLQQERGDDYVLATNECHSVRDFLEAAFESAGLDPYKYLKINKMFYRPAEVHNLQGDYAKAQKVLGWEPRVRFKDLVKEMVENDLRFFAQKKPAHDKFNSC